MPNSQARRRAPATGAVAVAGSRFEYEPTTRSISASGRSSTVYGRSTSALDSSQWSTGAVTHGSHGARIPHGVHGVHGPRVTSGRGAGGGPPRSRAAKARLQPPARRRKDPVWARLVVLLGALLMLLSGGAIVGGKALIYKATGAVERAPLLGGAGAGEGAKALQGPLNILMVGIDERPEGRDLVRADSILILHVPASRSGAYLVSIPRDTYVEIPPYAKSDFGGSSEKINAAFAHGWANGGGREGGFELLALTVQRMTGLRFNAGAIVDFHGFEAIVKALGGVDLCVDTKKPVYSEHVGFDKNGKYLHPRDGGKPMVYHPGECRRFKGWEALDYVRQRYSLEDGDYGRQRHQQQFIKALAKEAKKQKLTTNPKKLLEIIQAAGQTLTVDLRGASIESWVFTVRNVADTDVVLLKANGGAFHSVQCGAESCEGVTDETLDMFEAMRDDTVSDFVIRHPEFINS